VKNVWLWIVLSLIAFNLLLGYSYINRRTAIDSLFYEFTHGPDVYEFINRSQQVSDGLSLSRKQNSGNVEFAQASRGFSQALNVLDPKNYAGDEISFFEEKFPLTDGQQDSLWLAFRSYRQAVENVMAGVLPDRHDFHARYNRLVAIEQESNSPLDEKRKKALQVSLDSLARFPDKVFDIKMDDRKRLHDFIAFMQFRSAVGEEMKLNALLSKMDDLFPAKGKMILYRNNYLLNSLNAAEKMQLFNYSLVLKSETDEQLYSLTR
jgi:hypothetical protein